MKDTITAIATPLGYSAIGIIRISGPQAIRIAKKIFSPIRKKDLEKSSFSYFALWKNLLQ